MTTDAEAGQFHVDEVPLSRFLAEILPTYRTRLGGVDVPRLSEELNLSRQGVYRWFKVGRLTTKNVKRLCELAQSPDNLEILRTGGRAAPTRAEFDRFLYAD